MQEEIDWSDHIARLEAYHDLVKRFLARASANQASQYNKRRRKVKYKVGDTVMRREHYLSSGTRNFAKTYFKLTPPFSGPYKISKILSPTVYELTSQSGAIIPKVHVRFLKNGYGDSSSDNATDECLALSPNNSLTFTGMDNITPTLYVGVQNDTDFYVMLPGEDVQVYHNNPRLLALSYYIDTITPVYQKNQVKPAPPRDEVPVANLLDLTVREPTPEEEPQEARALERRVNLPPPLIPSPAERRVDRPPPARPAGRGLACYRCQGPHLVRDCPVVSCWICGGPHPFRECNKEETEPFCYLCGRPGVTKADCTTPRCIAIRRNDIATGRLRPPTAARAAAVASRLRPGSSEAAAVFKHPSEAKGPVAKRTLRTPRAPTPDDSSSTSSSDAETSWTFESPAEETDQEDAEGEPRNGHDAALSSSEGEAAAVIEGEVPGDQPTQDNDDWVLQITAEEFNDFFGPSGTP